MSVSDVLAITGGLTILYHLLKVSWKCWSGLRQFVVPRICPVDLRKYGRWAVVTGATSGIGKAYACELARRGLDVVLVSRSDEKLQAVAEEIRNQYRRKTRTIRVDFTEGQSIYPGIARGLEGLEIGILVNNVGMNICSKFEDFVAVPDVEKRSTQLVNCNMLSVVQMSRLVLPGMIQRGTGLIINMSSIMSDHPHPLLSLYSASKSFVTCFSRCLNAEYKSQGITIQSVNPFLVSTNMTKNIEVNCFMKNASEFAREALNTVGHSSHTSGCWCHALQDAALTLFVPDWLRFSQFYMRRLRNISEHLDVQEQEKLRRKEK